MIIKKNSIIVAILSSSIIAVVFVLTIIGFYIYINWKEDNNKRQYYDALRELNAKLYEKYVLVHSIIIKIDEQELFKDKPIVEGKITNKSSKRITSLKLEISILDNNNQVLYHDSFYPLRKKSYFDVISDETGNYLSSNDTISFKHLLANCPNEIEANLRMKTQFAKEKKTESINFNYEIEEMTVE